MPFYMLGIFLFAMFFGWVLSSSAFTSLVPLYITNIVRSSPELPGGQFNVTNLVDGNSKTEYASDKLGTNTLVEFDFSRPARIVGFCHVDRSDAATVAESELEFYGDRGQLLTALTVKHVNKRSGETFVVLPKPVTARLAKWRVTKLGNGAESAVGGAELAFLRSSGNDLLPKRDRIGIQILPHLKGRESQPVKVTINHPYAESAEVTLSVTGSVSKPLRLNAGMNEFELDLAAAQKPTLIQFELQLEGQTITRLLIQQEPVQPLTFHAFPRPLINKTRQ